MSKIFQLCSDMADITRWSHATCLRPESVLEHTAFVALYSLRLAYKYDVGVGDVLERAILHDIEEVITGDIPTPTKYANPQLTEQIKLLEDESALKVSQDYFFGCAYDPWSIAKDRNTDAGTIVYIADMAAAVYKIQVEHKLGNKDFHKYADNIYGRLVGTQAMVRVKFLPEVTELIEIIQEIKDEDSSELR